MNVGTWAMERTLYITISCGVDVTASAWRVCQARVQCVARGRIAIALGRMAPVVDLLGG